MLREHLEATRYLLAQMEISFNGARLVFSHPNGSPILPGTVSHWFRRLARKLGMPGIHFHSLRHTHATLMLKDNVHPKVVQERLGHSTISITLDTYSHVTPGLQEAAALRFDEGLGYQTVIKTPATP